MSGIGKICDDLGDSENLGKCCDVNGFINLLCCVEKNAPPYLKTIINSKCWMKK